MKKNPGKRLFSEIDGTPTDVIEESEEDEEENNMERDEDAPEDMLIDIIEKHNFNEKSSDFPKYQSVSKKGQSLN